MMGKILVGSFSLIGKYLQYYSYISKIMLVLVMIGVLDLFFNFIPFFAKKELVEIIIIISYAIYLLGINL